MDVVAYGVDEAPPGFRVVKSAEELRRHVGKTFLVVVGISAWRRSWAPRIFQVGFVS
jgi:hypothetical protein